MMRMWQGAFGLAANDAIVSPAYVVLRAKRPIDPLFASYFFRSSRLAHLFWAYSHGITDDRLRLYFNDFATIPAAIPPLAEQRRIAGILSTWDRAIETVEALIANARAQKAALTRQLLTGKRRLPGFSEPWRRVKLGQICRPKQWVTISSSEMISSGVPVFGANSYVGFFHAANHADDTVVISCRGSCGEVHLVPGPSYITGNAMCLDGAAANGVSLNLLVELIRHAGTRAMISGSAQPQIVRSSVVNFEIDLPSEEEQRALSKFFSDADRSLAAFESQLASLRQEKAALMQQLLTGKRRVSLAESEAA
jgi:type I restriction enzyme S subunit